MKASALRDMTSNELLKRLDETERELWGLRIRVSQQRNTSKIREMRRDIARIKLALAALGEPR